VARRVHVPALHAGRLSLPATEAHHVRDVLRLTVGDALELFDAAGRTAAGRVVAVSTGGVDVDVSAVAVVDRPAVALTVAAAVPKGDRADWMVEKLSELGVARFVPLAAARSVVLPGGRNKTDRWERIAVESAKQCRRLGVMVVDAVTPLPDVLRGGTGWVLSTEGDSTPVRLLATPAVLTVLVGPEGGWTADELAACAAAGWTAAGLGGTVLRVETAAVAVAAVVACGSGAPSGPFSPGRIARG
jgi:16S rRNA (uracil1498-N3)-methyltransferase